MGPSRPEPLRGLARVDSNWRGSAIRLPDLYKLLKSSFEQYNIQTRGVQGLVVEG